MSKNTSTLPDTNPYKQASTIQEAGLVTSQQLEIAADYARQLSLNPAWLQAGANLQDQLYTLLNQQMNALLTSFQAWIALSEV